MVASLIIPCAGLASRLGADLPKALVEINENQNLLDIILQKIESHFSEIIVVVSPAHLSSFNSWLEFSNVANKSRVLFVIQETPKGSLDASLKGLLKSSSISNVVVWGDQIGVLSSTVKLVLDVLEQGTDLVVPVTPKIRPYVWIKREKNGENITYVKRSRDGDSKPLISLADVGCFGFSQKAISFLNEEKFLSLADKVRESDLVYEFSSLSWSVKTYVPIIRNRRQTMAVNNPAELCEARRAFS
jgi:molybdopterin-guanine dinucleotide biosynthesis protein A